MLEAVLVLARLLVLLVAAFMAAPALALTPGGETASGRISASLDGEHTYFVGESAAWVHNACGFLYHYTDEASFKAITSQRQIGIKAFAPRTAKGHARGAYFSTKAPWELGTSAARRLGLSSAKTEYVFAIRANVDELVRSGVLKRLPGGRGDFVVYSPEDFIVDRADVIFGANPFF